MGVKPRLNEVKPPVDASDFLGVLSSELDKNPGANSAGEFDLDSFFILGC